MPYFVRTLSLLWCLVLLTFIPVLTGIPQQQLKEFTLEEIFSGKFSSKYVRGFQWMKNGRAFSYLERDKEKNQTDIWSQDVETGRTEKIVDAAKLILNKDGGPFVIQNYFWSPDENKILFTGTLPARSLKTGGNIFLYDFKKETFKQLTGSDQDQMNIKFSPDGSMAGFVRTNNIFILNLDNGQETQLTFDGGKHLFNGRFDWVYEEEFEIIDGWQWSPDSKYIAYWQIDENRVSEFPIIDFLPLHQGIAVTRYPKSGDPVSIVKIGVIPLKTKKTEWIDIGAPLDSTQNIYIPRIQWTNKPGILSFELLNRRQNRLDLKLADVTTGKTKIILTETDNTWVDVESCLLLFLKKSEQFIWASERDGYKHLYLYGLDGKLVRQLTQGLWDVDKLLGVDEKHGTVYFTASVVTPIERELYSVNLSGSGFRRITKEKGTNEANFAPDYSVFLHTFSDAATPRRSSLRKNDGSLIRVINEGEIEALKDYSVSPKTFYTFKTTDGIELYGSMIKPPDFDPGRKYPVIMNVYGGPGYGYQTVKNSWGVGGFFWHQFLSQQGYIIVSVDNRGVDGRGRDFKRAIYKNLGKWETHDLIEAARYLGALPYVDSSRIGIMGGSYGGYMALMCMLRGADVFKAGIAISAVTDWRYYDAIYTERYMLTPQENPEGYDQSSALTKAKYLKGSLLIIHGTEDDNVHLQNAVALINELTNQNKQFELSLYPGYKHGIGGKVAVQYYTKILNFILKNL